MKVKSLGRRTDFIFSKFSGSIIDRENYLAVKTPTNPGYHWGNYLIFEQAPKAGDLAQWKKLFDYEFPYYQEPHHYVFTWDKEEKGDTQEFLDANFDFDSGVVLTANSLRSPPHFNPQVEVRKMATKKDWESAIELQTLCADSKYLNAYYEDFKRAQFEQYLKMSEMGMGNWFGAFIGDKLVGDLGIFFEGDIARYQSVGTHPDFRRQGICGTLVYLAGQIALKDYGVQTLVMEADPDYHAARIYESVGFQRNEINYSLSWWKSKDSN